MPEYTAVLVRGVVDHWRTINEALETYARGWTLDRMPAVDRALLRVAAYEVLYVDDVPDGEIEAIILRELDRTDIDDEDDSPTFGYLASRFRIVEGDL